MGAKRSDFETYSNSQIAGRIDEWIRGDRERQMLKLRLIDLKTISELSEIFGLSEQRVKKILYTEQDRLFRKIK